ncbi:MAG: hypothetical protein QMD85_00265 [Candidatus Aenigmarchaeota archaeon]|nr:hypothetical protein [Candidatus Aenigmarchaeota archaeon]
MKAYLIAATQEVQRMFLFETEGPPTTRYVNAVYVPDRILLGYASDGEVVLSEDKSFLGAQDIVDGRKKGTVEEIELDDEALDKIHKYRKFNEVKSLIENFEC